jgi:hypothetical protein
VNGKPLQLTDRVASRSCDGRIIDRTARSDVALTYSGPRLIPSGFGSGSAVPGGGEASSFLTSGSRHAFEFTSLRKENPVSTPSSATATSEPGDSTRLAVLPLSETCELLYLGLRGI